MATDHISAFLLTEPDVGSDPARMSASALPTEECHGCLINGTKLWATNGVIADVVVVMAVIPKTERSKGGITAFICPMDTDGITVTRRKRVHGAARPGERGHRVHQRVRPEGERDRG